MEGIAPLLQSILEVEHALKSGRSVRFGVEKYCSDYQGDWSNDLKAWVLNQGAEHRERLRVARRPHRGAFLTLLAAGFAGQSIHKEMMSLKEEVTAQCEEDVEEFIKSLPFKLLLPLLFFVFPAFMLLLLGPIFSQVMVAI